MNSRKRPNAFLLTPLREGRPERRQTSVYEVRNFYSRPYARGDKDLQAAIDSYKEFLLTPLREGRLELYYIGDYNAQFLLTPLREGRLRDENLIDPMYIKFLLTPLREGRLTILTEYLSPTIIISTHAPTRGATKKKVYLTPNMIDFYSRPYARGDL